MASESHIGCLRLYTIKAGLCSSELPLPAELRHNKAVDSERKSGWFDFGSWVAEHLFEGIFEPEFGPLILAIVGCAVVLCLVLFGVHQWLSDPGTTMASIIPGSTDFDTLSINPDNWKF